MYVGPLDYLDRRIKGLDQTNINIEENGGYDYNASNPGYTPTPTPAAGPPAGAPPPVPSAAGAPPPPSGSAGSGGPVYGSANGGNISQGSVYGGTIYNSADGGTYGGTSSGGSGNTYDASTTTNTTSAAPGGMPPGGLPPVPGTPPPSMQEFVGSSRTSAPSAGTDLTSRLFSLPQGTSDLPSDFMEASGWGWQVPEGQGACPAGYYRDPYGNCVAR